MESTPPASPVSSLAARPPPRPCPPSRARRPCTRRVSRPLAWSVEAKVRSPAFLARMPVATLAAGDLGWLSRRALALACASAFASALRCRQQLFSKLQRLGAGEPRGKLPRQRTSAAMGVGKHDTAGTASNRPVLYAQGDSKTKTSSKTTTDSVHLDLIQIGELQSQSRQAGQPASQPVS